MNRKKLFYQLFPSYLAIIIITVVALTWFTNRSLQNFYYKQKTDDLKARAILIGQKISADGIEEISHLTKVCRDLGQATGTRITLISPTGKVLGDSHENPEIMDNHGDRPEVTLAFEGKTGTSIRYSHTLELEMMYLAIPVNLNESSIIVRTSLPVTSLQETISQMRGRIIFGGIIIALIATGLNFFVSRRVVRPLEDMKQGAQRFARGELDHKLTAPGTEEIGALADSLNQMASQLDRRIKTVLQQRNEQDAILTSMTEGVLATDKEEKVISLNQAAAEFLEINKATAVGKTVQALVRNSELYQFIRDLLSGDKNLQIEITLSAPTDRYLKVTGAILKGADGSQIGVLIVLNDITEIRRLENIRRDFVANVSHELKTPITSIKGYVETLRDGTLEDAIQTERFLAIIARQADRLNAIVDDLLELSRIEQQEGKRDFPLQIMPLKPVLEGAVQDCQEQAGRKQVVVNIECDDRLATPLNGPLLQQALVNLINNAIKYSESGRNVLITGAEIDGEVVISVRDFGIGIAREHFARLFERFYRVDKARSREMGGTGLGLAIVKHIAQLHNGSVSVKSKPGEGSAFSIKLRQKLTKS